MSSSIRAEQNALLLWDLSRARTAYLDGPELETLARWARGEENGFARRLMKLGLLENGMREEILGEIALAQEKAAPPRSFCAPESLHIELTARCPLSCPQCYKSPSPADLPMEKLRDILRQAAKLRVFQIALGGGEPLVYPFLEEAVEAIGAYGMSCSVTTSGYGIRAPLLKKLTERGLRHLQVSLNGSTAEIHERSRQGYATALEALRLLAQTRLSYGINWVARMDNIDDLPDLLALAVRLGAQNVNILREKPAARQSGKSVGLTDDKLLYLETVLRNTKGITLKVDSAFSGLLCRINGRPGLMTGCGAGRRFLAVDAEGGFRPCSHLPMRETGTLADVWFHSPILQAFRELPQRVGDPCRSCSFLEGCGGCRAVALAYTGDFYAGDPGCPAGKSCVF